ncbi:multi-sensor signal transduction histidine kinase [Natrialba hulunbeirensis JCM 10989]|uniref:histidine kinase n=1 Tax=Natrialba hulunbeirensis JCM 10989 TaxID=1227493 RepID=M0A3Z0_9EURY|nr:ATP-binding protein [Natrialba hulunbeirensis]ELY93465.1 multi-sensor signal transduction histidine kinase [Natrialba hulunbeirensis JCM 10989]
MPAPPRTDSGESSVSDVRRHREHVVREIRQRALEYTRLDRFLDDVSDRIVTAVDVPALSVLEFDDVPTEKPADAETESSADAERATRIAPTATVRAVATSEETVSAESSGETAIGCSHSVAHGLVGRALESAEPVVGEVSGDDLGFVSVGSMSGGGTEDRDEGGDEDRDSGGDENRDRARDGVEGSGDNDNASSVRGCVVRLGGAGESEYNGGCDRGHGYDRAPEERAKSQSGDEDQPVSVSDSEHDQPWGLLTLTLPTDTTHQFNEADIAFLQRVATVLESAIRNVQAKQRPEPECTATEAGFSTHDRVVQALETASEGISLLDEEGTFIYVNSAYAALYGYEPESMIGMHWERLYPEGMTDDLYEDMISTLQEGESWSGETVGLRRDGSQFIEDHYLAPTDDGGMVCVVRDVTKRRQLEEELDEVHTRITDAFIGIDTDWTFTYVNDSAVDLLDASDEALVGRSFWSVFPDTDDVESILRDAAATQESVSFEANVPALDAWLEINAYPSETGLSIYLRDVSDREETKRELRKSNRTLQRLYEITADRERSFEEKVDDLLELGRERLDLPVGFVSAVDADRNRFEVAQSIGGREIEPGATAPLSETYCRETIDTDDLLVLIDSPPAETVSDAAYERWDFDAYVGGKVMVDDTLYGTLCFAGDDERPAPFSPAEQRFVELATQWLSYEYERQRRQTELETLVSNLESSNERLEQFAHAASHDLQEPLRMVSSYLQLLDSRYREELDDEGAEFLEFAVNGADRMRAMIDGLLEYARVETRGEPLEPVELDTIVEEVRKDLQVQVTERDAEITVESLPRVQGDESQLRQVVQNLLSNALVYNDEESPTVHVSAERRTWDDECVISIADDGIGIDADDQERIFSVFDRLHSREEFEGTGIGLALCQRIVERHGGTIWVESEPGEGTTISFTLPLAE